MYYELMILGRVSPDRAINFAATNAYQASDVFKDAIKKGMVLDNIETNQALSVGRIRIAGM